LVIYIDFRKAFDVIDHDLLLQKMKLYNFSNEALNLVESYLLDRCIITKINNATSNTKTVPNGVPQGSVIGSLLFLIFINDLPSYLQNIDAILFADDTTIYFSAKTQNELITKVEIGMQMFCEWCQHNRLDINMEKTYAMFFTDKRISKLNVENGQWTNGLRLPDAIAFNDNRIKVINEYDLLGVSIQSNLQFTTHVQKIKRQVNIRSFSFEKLHYFSFSVKLQFLKTFILPLFDYCSTLVIYFNKQNIQKLAKIYHYSIYRLIKFQINTSSISEFNNLLQKYGLMSFQHRITIRLLKLVHKILSNEEPKKLFNLLDNSYGKHTSYNLRNDNSYHAQNKHGHVTFLNFFSSFINSYCINLRNLSKKDFDKFIELHLDEIVVEFIAKDQRFEFDIQYLKYYERKRN
jgi:hypothetical protein